MLRFHRAGLLVAAAFMIVLAACAGPRAAREPVRDDRPLGPVESAIPMAEYEDFDASAYREEARDREPAIEHEVPRQLMEGRVVAATPRTARGFRLQLFSTQDKAAADQFVEDAMTWWRSAKESGGASPLYQTDQPPVYIFYRQPYYRVRMGNFATRDQAQRVLGTVMQRFPAASIVPDDVLLR
jgi:hypothetical protein